MQIENIARIGLATGRLAGEQRELAMGYSVFGQIVDYDQSMLATIPEILGNRKSGEGRDPLQSRRGRRRGDDKHATLGSTVLSYRLDHASHRGRALADRHIDTDQVGVFLIDDRVNAYRCLAGSAVANDELALATPYREQGIDGENTRLHRLGDEVALDDAGGWAFDRHLRFGLDRLVTVEGPSKRIDDTAQKPGPDGNAHN